MNITTKIDKNLIKDSFSKIDEIITSLQTCFENYIKFRDAQELINQEQNHDKVSRLIQHRHSCLSQSDSYQFITASVDDDPIINQVSNYPDLNTLRKLSLQSQTSLKSNKSSNRQRNENIKNKLKRSTMEMLDDDYNNEIEDIFNENIYNEIDIEINNKNVNKINKTLRIKSNQSSDRSIESFEKTYNANSYHAILPAENEIDKHTTEQDTTIRTDSKKTAENFSNKSDSKKINNISSQTSISLKELHLPNTQWHNFDKDIEVIQESNPNIYQSQESLEYIKAQNISVHKTRGKNINKIQTNLDNISNLHNNNLQKQKNKILNKDTKFAKDLSQKFKCRSLAYKDLFVNKDDENLDQEAIDYENNNWTQGGLTLNLANIQHMAMSKKLSNDDSYTLNDTSEHKSESVDFNRVFMQKSMIGFNESHVEKKSIDQLNEMNPNNMTFNQEQFKTVKKYNSKSKTNNNLSLFDKSRLVERIDGFQLDNYEEVILQSDNDLEHNIHIFQSKDFQIPDTSLFTQIWSLLITLILGFQIISFPYENFSEPTLTSNWIYIIFNLTIEQVFIVDIIINFFTAYRDKYGHLIKRNYDIYLNQLNSWFTLDLISSVPSNNLVFFNLIPSTGNFNNYLKILKLPKQIRVLKGFMNIFENKVSSTIDFDSIVNLNPSEQMRLTNITRYLTYFMVICNLLSCQLIGFTKSCNPDDSCFNWFYPLMRTEYLACINNSYTNTPIAIAFNNEQGIEEGSIQQQNWVLSDNRWELYLNAWQYVMQTVTTVGYGDIITTTSEERVFRIILMIIGSILFSLLSSNVLESFIAETLNIWRKNEHEVMIEKLQTKYNIRGDPKRFLNLLGDSVYTEKLQIELEFTRLLPTQMRESVLKQIWKVQLNKMILLQEESLNFFIMMMSVSNFRRCVQEEIVCSEREKISIVQSGRLGCQVSNLRDQVQQEYLQYLGVGEEIGYHNQLNIQSSYYNQMYKCTVNSEVVEINATDYSNLISHSLKGMDQIQNNLVEQLIELQLTVSLQQSMLQIGLQIEQKWYKKMMVILKFQGSDMVILKKIQENFAVQKSRNLDKRIQKKQDVMSKWQLNILDNEIYRHIVNKAKDLVIDLVDSKYELLKYYTLMLSRRKTSTRLNIFGTKKFR